jgi:hypothetical protein
VAYRVSYTAQGSRRRARIHEIRIVPKLPSGFDPALDSGTVPASALSFAALRRRVTARHFGHAMQAVRVPDPKPARVATRRRGPGRPPLPAHFYASLAVHYARVENDTRRDGRESTRDKLAAHYQVPVTTIAKWIHMARQRGFLTSVARGERGGQVTELAARVVSQQRKKGAQ